MLVFPRVGVQLTNNYLGYYRTSIAFVHGRVVEHQKESEDNDVAFSSANYLAEYVRLCNEMEQSQNREMWGLPPIPVLDTPSTDSEQADIDIDSALAKVLFGCE